MPLAARSYIVGVCDTCGFTSPQWGLYVSAPQVFATARQASEALPHQGWWITRKDDSTLRVLCPRCACERHGHDLTRARRGRQSCRRCGTAWHDPHWREERR